MSVVVIYKLEDSDSLKVKGRWEDGEWIYDKGNFADIEGIDEYTDQDLFERFDGPFYYATRENSLSQLKESLNIEHKNSVRSSRSISSFMEAKLDFVEKYKNDELDKDEYDEEMWNNIKSWVELYG